MIGLEKAVRSLAKIYGEDVVRAWTTAYGVLHIRGFHEKELTTEQVRGEV